MTISKRLNVQLAAGVGIADFLSRQFDVWPSFAGEF
jgi:hypothetical protein